ncbi:hypothetical protein ACF1HU_35895 [Streptomyces olivaceus]|uniref:hypothetical protein n=1 Tax=Streptomyces olivaceus TaxID=47716 RepID=UPI0036F92B56
MATNPNDPLPSAPSTSTAPAAGSIADELSAAAADFGSDVLSLTVPHRSAPSERPPAQPQTAEERLATIAELITPCPPPDVANGYDMCLCGAGVVWPCNTTKAAWLAGGHDVAQKVRALMDEAMRAASFGSEE